MASSLRSHLQLQVIGVFLAVAFAGISHGALPSFWVWQRSAPLSAEESKKLQSIGVGELYWQIGTITSQEASWKWTERFPIDFDSMRKVAPRLHFVPVLRLEPPPGWAFSPASSVALEKLAGQIIEVTGSDKLQIDYEASDRSIPAYAQFLRHLKAERSWHLSITALGHWSKYASQMVDLVDEITPMFYDLNPRRESLSNGRLANLIEPSSADIEIEEWKNCPIPWKAGLPNFSRVTVVDGHGMSRGHLRSWTWDDIWFSPLLESLSPTSGGQTVFDVLSSGILGVTPVRAGEKVVVRYPDLNQSKQLAAKAEQAGSQGVIYFRLADGTDMSGYAAYDILENASETVTVSSSSADSITLSSNRTLMPVVTQTHIRGYALGLKTDGEGWREAIPGQFVSISLDPADTRPTQGDLGLGTTTLYFRFSSIPAGGALKTGLLQHAPKEPVQWSVQGVDSDSQWHPLD